jgi:hypothetical protein
MDARCLGSGQRGWRYLWCSGGGWPLLAARATRCWLRVRTLTRFVADGRVLTEGVAWHRAGAGDDYACRCRSPPWEHHLAHLPLHVVSSENLVWISWMDDDGAWALQSPWRRHLLDHRRLFLDGFCDILTLKKNG